jgi:hypothetical protein
MLKVWFQLVDQTGNPYKGTRAGKVTLDSSADIVDFLDAVKVKYDQPNYLKDFPSVALLVYRNRETFDKRNAEEGKEVPLKVDAIINGLGVLMKEALIVVVPRRF